MKNTTERLFDSSVFFKLIPDLICIADTKGMFLEVNNAWEQVFGYSGEELRGKFCHGYIHPDDLEKTVAEAKRLQEVDQEPIYFENRYRSKDGEYRWLSWTARVCDGIFYGIARDITQAKGREIQSERTRQLLKAFVVHSPAGIMMTDREMRIIAVSRKFVSEFQFSEEEVTGRTIYEIFPDSHKRRQLHQEMLKGKSSIEQIDVTKKDGTVNTYSITTQPWYEDDEVTTGGLICLNENITEKRRSERSLHEKRTLIHGILNHMPVIIYRFDRSGIITQADGNAMKRLGIEKEDVIGKSIFDLFPEYDELKNVLNGEVQYFTTREELGKGYFFQNFLYPDNLNGGALGFCLDITEEWKATKELKNAKEQAEKANQAKTRFLASMSHEIRTPINAILGFAEILSKKDLPPGEQEYLRFILSAGNTLIKIIGDILDLSKIEEGKLELEETAFDLKEEFLNSLIPYKFRANENGLNFSFQFDEFLPGKVVADSHKIKQILVNLISNSLKFTKEGSITVRFSNEAQYEQAREILLKVEVADTGIGIAEGKHAEIFEAFVQEDPSIAKEYGGSGLGLAIVQKLVRLMNGEIRAISPSNYSGKGGPGTTFEVRMKVKVTGENDLKIDKPAEDREEIRGLKVLVAEDNLMNRKLIEVLLVGLGCQADFAGNGEEVVDMFPKKEYDFILMDVQMPGMDGLEATRLIRESDPCVPIIGVTANVYKDDVENCLEAGMNDFLGKPFTQQQLRDVLVKWKVGKAD